MTTFAEWAEADGVKYEKLANVFDDNVLQVVQRFYESNAETFRRASTPEIPFVIDLYLIDDPTFNAFAGSFSDADVIGINRGVFRALLTMSRGLCGYFRPAENNAIGYCIPWGPRYILENPDIFIIPARADEPAQEEFAQIIYEYAVLFILNHELAHILNGHTQWVDETQGMRLLYELPTADRPRIVGLESETIEWDADCAAVECLLADAVRPMVVSVEGRARWTIEMSLDPGPYPSRFIAMVAGTLICALLFSSSVDGAIDDLTPRTHPHSIIRFHLIVGQMAHVLAYRTGAEIEVVWERLIPGLQFMLRSWCKLFGQANLDHLGDIGSRKVIDVYNDRLDAYNRTWEVLYSTLDGLSRGNVLAPPQPVRHPAFPDIANYG